jgi:hypothetical protein
MFNLHYFNIVDRLEFVCDSDGACSLSIVLRSETAKIQADFMDVSQLELSEFGGGLTQLLQLKVTDVSADQLDRVRFRVTESERQMISFSCHEMRIHDMEPLA